MKKYFLPAIAGLVMLIFTTLPFYSQADSYSSDQPGNSDKSEIKLPWEVLKGKPFDVVNPANSVQYRQFAQKYGNWTFVMNSRSGVIERAFGDAIRLSGLDVVNRDNIIRAADNFISENSAILGINTSDIRLSRANEVNGRWYVGYKQYYKGIEVLLSDIGLRIFNNGNLSNFSVVNYQGISIDAETAQITPSEASQLATIGVKFNPATDETETSGKLFILPYYKSGKTEFRLVYKVLVNTAEPFARYFAYVDANSGETLWRRNTVLNESKIKTHGDVKLRFGNDPFTDRPFADMDISVNGVSQATNADGEIEFDQTDSVTLNAKFTGKWAKVTMKSGAPRSTANFISKIEPGKDFEIIWNDSNSHKTERNLFYHANWVHDYIKAIDTSLTVMDFQLNVSIDFKGTSPNAYSSGKAIGYIGVGVAEMRLPECASVLYHEYGHSVNGLLYDTLGASNGMINLSCNEGTADLFSSLVQDESRMGVGAWTYDSTKIIRTLDNNLKYPTDLQADGHFNGQILGGAYWDLRKATNLDYVRRLSHFTKYGLPDDANIGIAFSEWFFETLNADDDDGNLTNGTPNALEIIKAFNNHNIGTNLLLQLGFSHTQYQNTLETKQPYELNFTLTTLSFAGVVPDSVSVIWSTDNFSTINVSIAEKTGTEGAYKALIPAQAAGMIVQYYMHAWEPLSGSSINFYKSFDSQNTYRFLVGYNSVFYDAFDINNGWTAGSPTDDATRGKWENGIPNQIDMTLYGIGIIQPGKDHSEEGLSCWVTGPKGTMAQYLQHMPNGRTTLISPDYQLEGYLMPIVKYFKWFYNIYAYPSPGFETNWQTDISFDGGLTWMNTDRTTESTDGWEEEYIMLKSYMPEGADSFRLRFIFDVPKYTNSPYSLSEGLIDDFEILSVDPTLVGVNDIKQNESVSVYPNPFTNRTIIAVDKNQKVDDLSIYNLLGFKVRSLTTASSNNAFVWDGTGDDGSRLGTGLYIYKAVTGNKTLSGKIILE